MISTTINFLKNPSVRCCAGSSWLTYSWQDLSINIFFKKNHYQERLDPINSKKNVVLWRMPIGCTNYISKYSKRKDLDISNINPTLRQNMIFMHNISRKYSNQQLFQYSKKYKNLKEQRKTRKLPRNKKRCVQNAKISWEIRERNTQHEKNKKKM
jgi:hypothetical protein